MYALLKNNEAIRTHIDLPTLDNADMGIAISSMIDYLKYRVNINSKIYLRDIYTNPNSPYKRAAVFIDDNDIEYFFGEY